MGQDMDKIGGAFSAVAPEADNLIEAIKMTFATAAANNLWIIIGIVVSFLIMIMGVAGGIEKSCKIMIPALYVLFIALAVLMIFTPGTSEGYKYIFSVNWEGFLNPQVWVYAFGQCFFSLSVAGSGSVVYGSYLGDDVKIRQSAIICAIMDTSAALLAMQIIIPAMSTVGADLGNGGPGLMFIYVLPVFNNMGAIARLIVIFFYVAILFAGVSSVINLFEVPINFLQDRLHLGRVASTAIIHVVGLIVALMIQPWTSQWMDTVSIFILPLGALTAGIMYFWVMKRETAIEAAQLGLGQARYEMVHSVRQVCIRSALHRVLRTGHRLGRHRLITFQFGSDHITVPLPVVMPAACPGDGHSCYTASDKSCLEMRRKL